MVTKKTFLVILSVLMAVSFVIGPRPAAAEKIGVVFAIHGGNDEAKEWYFWEFGVQQMTYRPDHIVHKNFIYNKTLWYGILTGDETALKFVGKSDLLWGRLGGIEPSTANHLEQFADLQDHLNAAACDNTTFVFDWMAWIAPDRPEHFPYPRFLYNVPSHIVPQPFMPAHTISGVTYCGEQQTNEVVVNFDGGTAAFNIGATVTGSTTGASATIDDVVVTSGSWAGGDAAGTLYLSNATFVTGSCGRSGNPCTPAGGCGFIEACVGDQIADELITDDGAVPGSATAVGTIHWEGCDPERYNVDGPAERLVAAGVDRIVIVDATVGCVRFFKTYEALQMFKRALDDAGASSIPVTWVNDLNNLMENSYPTAPIGYDGVNWTPDLNEPTVDPSIPLSGNPNPIAEDPTLALLHVEGIEQVKNPLVDWADTGVLILNHAHRDYGQAYDPKIDDTMIINLNIESQLLSRHPGMDPNNIIGAYMGIKENGEDEGGPGCTQIERTRAMRGENLGHAWLYEGAGEVVIKFKNASSAFTIGETLTGATSGDSAVIVDIEQEGGTYGGGNACGSLTLSGIAIAEFDDGETITDTGGGSATADSLTQYAYNLPGGKWGYMYWDALEILKNQGVQHIIICFPQLLVTNFYDVEIPNQIGKEIGYKTWLDWPAGDPALFPDPPYHPFADYWGEWIDPFSCTVSGGDPVTNECCFEMGGCGDPARPYPPPRQTTGRRGDFDPSLVYDMSEFGHLGYDETGASGAPDPNNPVQDQYTGTWEMWRPPDGDDRVGQLLADHIIDVISCTPTLIQLSSLEANAANNRVVITWSTEAEIDNAGFNVLRADAADGDYTKINAALIPAAGTPTQGASYSLIDTDVRNRNTYYYKLEDIDTNGKITQHGPVSATPRLITAAQ